ncbi:hypothetical protein PALB_1420 [Pseudoalteromonas luteoviolacea B = ATCC 29581]|nr:hypothetical protein PALB_1420 [Pseudoalteromonas luteoviolacea B = ATCC 29581]
MPKRFKQFGPEYWDKYGVYRAPIAFNLSLIVLLRAYIIWIFAAASMQPDSNIMAIFYQTKNEFFVSLAIASGALIAGVVYSFRRPNAPRWLKPIWRFMKWPLVASACLDLAWLIWHAQQVYYQFSAPIAVQIVLLIWVLWYLLKSRYLDCFFSDWPQDEKQER